MMYLSVLVSDVVGTESEMETTRPVETLRCINQVAAVSILTYSNTYGFPLFFLFGAIAPFRANVEWERTVEGPFLGGGLLSERERETTYLYYNYYYYVYTQGTGRRQQGPLLISLFLFS